MKTKMETFDYPRRKPWILVLILLAVGGIVFLRLRTVRQGGGAGDVPGEEAAAQGPQENRPAKEVLPRGAFSPVSGASGDGRRLETAGDLVGARAAYLRQLESTPDPARRRDIETRLGRVNCELYLLPYPAPGKEEYVVQRGDSLERIARKKDTTIDLIQRSNKLANANVIKIGDRLRVLLGTFSIEISKEQRELVLHLDGKFFKRYRVGIGKFDKTPEGTFAITDKEKEPVWWPEGREVPFGHPDNVLGTRWMAIKSTGDTPPVRGYGIHGTWQDDSIGKAESAGCVRLVNADVEELFTFVPSGTPVIIRK